MTRPRKLNQRQIDKLSDILSDVGLVFFATLIIPAIFDKFDLGLLLLGAGATVLVWVASLQVRR